MEVVKHLLAHPVDEEGRARVRHGLGRRLDRVAGRQRDMRVLVVFRARDVALVEHPLEHEVPSLRGGLRMRDRVVAVGGGHDPGEERRLRGGQQAGAMVVGAPAAVQFAAEVDPRGRLDPVRAVAEVDGVEVLGEDLALGPLAREVVRERRLAQLLEHGPVVLRLQRVLDELLRDGGAALRTRAQLHVGEQRAGHAAQVDALVLVEALVLDRDDRVLHRRRDLVGGDEDAVLVVGQDRQRTAAIVEQDRLLRVAELLLVLELGQVGGDRHHHPEHGRDEGEHRPAARG